MKIKETMWIHNIIILKPNLCKIPMMYQEYGRDVN